MFLINGKKRSSTIPYEKSTTPPSKNKRADEVQTKEHHIVDSGYKELAVSAMLHIKEGSVVNSGPWQRAKTPPHRPACGATIAKYGTAILHKIKHGGKPKNRYRYLPWPIFDNTERGSQKFSI
jgi:hypothetical protein